MFNKKTRKIVTVTIGVLACSAVLSGCEDDEQSSSHATITSDTATHQAKIKDGKKYPLAYFENKITNSARTQYYILGFYKNGKLVQKQLASDWIDNNGHVNNNDYFEEIIKPNVTKPYVMYKNDKYFIVRPPYNQFNQPVIKGKVTGKEGK